MDRKLLLITRRGYCWPDLPVALADERPFQLQLATDQDVAELESFASANSVEAVLIDGDLGQDDARRLLGTLRERFAGVPLLWVSAGDELPESVCRTLGSYERRLQTLLDSQAEGFWEWDIVRGEIFFSPRWIDMLGYRQNDFVPAFNSWVDLIHPDDLGRFLLDWTEFMEGREHRFHIEYRLRKNTGDYIWVEARGASIRNSSGTPEHLAGSHNDISVRKQAERQLLNYRDLLEEEVKERTRELEAANQRLLALSRIDPLTGLLNRRALDEQLTRELPRSLREQQELGLLIVDIDHFKYYNDQLGHLTGDKCLQLVARAIESCLVRAQDIAARFGGEEFVVLLPGTDLAGVARVAEKIRQAIGRLGQLPDNPVTGDHLTVSIGATLAVPQQSVAADALLERADAALYRAKDSGRDCVVVMDEKGLLTRLTAESA